MANRRYIGGIDSSVSLSPSLIVRVDPGYPLGADVGLYNAMQAIDELLESQPAIFCKIFSETAANGYLFVSVPWGQVRHSSLLRTGAPAITNWPEISLNVEFEKWTVPEKPDYWTLADFDENNFVGADYVLGNPVALRMTSFDALRDVTLRFPGLTPNVGILPPFTKETRGFKYIITINEPKPTPVYAYVQGVGDLNNGDPLNETAATVQGVFQFPTTETTRPFELQLRPKIRRKREMYAVVESVGIQRQVNSTPVVDRKEWTYQILPNIVAPNVPEALPRRENFTNYASGDTVFFGWRYYSCLLAGRTSRMIPAWDEDTGNVTDGSVVWSPIGTYHGECVMANPALVDVFGAATTVQTTPPGGGPDIWDNIGLTLTQTSTTHLFIEQETPFIFETPSDTTVAALKRDMLIADVAVASVDNDWHTVLAIIEWSPNKPPNAVLEIEIDSAVMVSLLFLPDGDAPTAIKVDLAVEDVFVAGEPYAIGPDRFAYWVCLKFVDGAFPSDATWTTIKFFPAGKGGNNAGTGCAPLCLQMALGVKGPYYPASTPYSLSSAFHPGDQIRLNLAQSGRPENIPYDPKRGTIFLMASPIRNELPGQVIAPPLDERVVGVGNDCFFGVDTNNYVFASQGANRQYLALGAEPIPDYPPDYYVIVWDAYANRMINYCAWSRLGQMLGYIPGDESGVVKFSGDGNTIDFSSQIYRAWHIHHVSVFDRPLTADEIAELLPRGT